ncbi:MAG: DUF1294 domain-containing protein [Syntrophomonadaceae bacterium]
MLIDSITTLKIILYYLMIVNTICYFMFFWDKRLATRGRRRISEKSLFLAAVLGGSLGGLLAMYMFRHKTLHRKFKLGMPLILIIQLALLVYLLG